MTAETIVSIWGKLQILINRLSPEQQNLLSLGVAILAFTGWTCFAYSAWSSRTLQAEAKTATAKYEAMKNTAAQLKQELSASRLDYSRALQAEAEANAIIATLEREFTAQTKRPDQAQDGISEKGPAIETPKPGKKPEKANRRS